MKGEPIEPLGLTAKQLNAAVCCGSIGRPSDATAKALPVVTINGRPHVVTGRLTPAGSGRPEEWQAVPLWTEEQFAERFPGWTPTDEGYRQDIYLGVPVLVGKGKQAAVYRVGAKGEKRSLIEFAPKKGKVKA